MWTLSQAVCMGLLAGISVVDIYFRKLPAVWLLAGNVAALGYQIFVGKGDVWLIMGGIGIGILFLLVSKVTGESMGYGDSWTILIMGMYLGIWELIEVLAGAFFLLAIFSVIGLTVKKMSKRLRIPFLPFLAAGYLLNVVTGGIKG